MIDASNAMIELTRLTILLTSSIVFTSFLITYIL